MVAEERSRESATWFGQPRGLFVIAGLELWDRISFQGMQALLTLYLAGVLLKAGHVEHIWGFAGLRGIIEGVRGPLSIQAMATQVFGLYVAFVYMMPMFGGLLGDRLIGRRRAVVLGALLMTAGHFCMAFEQSVLLALLLLILGAGTLRGNLAPQLGELYSKEDRRRTFAFQIYGSSVNLGLFIAPLVTGWLQQAYNWHVAFAFAGFGMLVGLAIYLSGNRYLPKETSRTSTVPAAPLTQADKRMIAWLLALVPVASLFWLAQSQVWNTYNFWVRDHVRLSYGHWTM
ncbi:MAG TPA: oligopeptide:H+ symporter, partial [Rhizomicrobium sp.]|nr:oligopeptide:H+ symporter [Rhizomicrobium sp.]